MRRTLKILGGVLGVIVLLVAAIAVLAVTSDNLRIHMPVEQTERFEHEALASFPAALHVRGNRLVTARGEAVRLRGLMPSEPYELEGKERFDRAFFEEMAATGANVIRIPVHPHAWSQNADYLWRYLDPAVAWAGELGLYVIIDWHSIGNVETGEAPLLPELYSHTEGMTVEFWAQVAGYFRDTPHVLFEVFNEPQGISPKAWQRKATELVGVIREQGARQPAIAGGTDYARDLSWVLEMPIEDNNVVYASHIYPAHDQSLWGLYFGRVAERYPVLVSEWGFMEETQSAEQPYLNGSAAGYGEALMSYLEERQIGWVACWYDDEAEPPMLQPGWEGYTAYGEYVMDRLQSAPQKGRAHPDGGASHGSITIEGVRVTAGEQIVVRGRSTLPDGTCLGSELWADGENQAWWSGDTCVAVENGTWQMVVRLGEGAVPEELDRSAQYMLRVFQQGGPNIVAVFAFDLAGPPTAEP
jgi:hypothetical protein